MAFLQRLVQQQQTRLVMQEQNRKEIRAALPTQNHSCAVECHITLVWPLLTWNLQAPYSGPLLQYCT